MKSTAFLKYEINPLNFNKFPLNWGRIFPSKAPLAVEIGCGNGEYLVSWSHQHPTWNIVGIDVKLESIERSQARLFSHGIENVRVVRGDARFTLKEIFPDESLMFIIMNFPDPWPKEKHRQRRLITSDFVKILSALLQYQATFELVTDQLWFADAARVSFLDSDLFWVEELKEMTQRLTPTKYERKWHEQNRKSYHFLAHKQKYIRIKRILEDPVMPHVFVTKKVESQQVFALKNLKKQQDKKVFVIKAVYADPENRSYILRAVCADDLYQQNIFIIVAEHPRGYIVKLDNNVPAYRTPAVKMAVKEIGQLLSLKCT
jgi:tRNA (guanine-N7-)-methyltransferase